MANPFLTIGAVVVGVALTGIGILQVPGWIASAQDAKARADLSQIADAQGAALATTGGYAQSLAELQDGVVGGVATGMKVQLSAGSDAALYPGDDWGGITQSQSGTWFALCAGDSGATAYETEEDAKIACGISTGAAPEADARAKQIALTLDTTANMCSEPAVYYQSGAEGTTIDWGDGTTDTIGAETTQTRHPHTYATPGAYEVTITGTVPAYGVTRDQYIEDQGTGAKFAYSNFCITGVERLGEKTEITSLSYAFAYAMNMHEVEAELPPTVTSLEGTFLQSGLQRGVGGWDVSGVTSMFGTFWAAFSFNEPLSGWDTSSVTTTQEMFQDARAFNQDISGWDMSSVMNAASMFRYASVFDQNLSRWDVSSVTDMTDMFAFTAMSADLSGWDVRNVTARDRWGDESKMTTEPAWR